MKWARAKTGGRARWHVVTEIEHFRDEYPNGDVLEGDLVRTLCKQAGGLLDNYDVWEYPPEHELHERCVILLEHRNK